MPVVASGDSTRADETRRSSLQLPSERARRSGAESDPAGPRATRRGTANDEAPALGPATRTTKQRRPPLRKNARTAGARYARTSAPVRSSQKSVASRPNSDSNCAGSSIATGTSIGPNAANPTNTAMSIRGRTASGGGPSAPAPAPRQRGGAGGPRRPPPP